MTTKRSFPFDSVRGREIKDLPQPGYYNGFSTLAQKDFWDEATLRVVEERVEQTPPIRFFNEKEAATMQAIVDRLVPQDDRAADRTIPILPVIDERLFKNRLNGFRYEDMPPDQEAYLRGVQAIDEMAMGRYGVSFVDASVHQQELLLKSLRDQKPEPDHHVWQTMPVGRFWSMLLEDCVTAYYAHPWAWDEIGFGGPSYPRGYMRLENGLPEPWEKDEQRYEWNAPADSVSELELPDNKTLAGNGGGQ
uniref:Gluconate 2-dehydrogenase subunit 3 family protein n=1 Tax=Acidobacterium capsulatum TaxID=33075 RepID=A0A7V4XQA0_9BACT